MGTRPASAACLRRASLFTPSEVAGPRLAASFFLVVAGLQTGAFVLVGARRGGLRPSCSAIDSPLMAPQIQTLFTCLITLQFLVVAAHDLLDIPGWTHGSQVRALVGQRKLWLATMINSIFPGAAAAFAFYFWNKPKPGFVTGYWVLYCAVTVASAIAMWYVP
jgi:hypothetical protein